MSIAIAATILMATTAAATAGTKPAESPEPPTFESYSLVLLMAGDKAATSSSFRSNMHHFESQPERDGNP